MIGPIILIRTYERVYCMQENNQHITPMKCFTPSTPEQFADHYFYSLRKDAILFSILKIRSIALNVAGCPQNKLLSILSYVTAAVNMSRS